MIYVYIYYNYIKQIIIEQLAGTSIQVYLLTILLCLILVNMILMIYNRITGKEVSMTHRFLYNLLLIYACFIFQVALYRRIGDDKVGISLSINFGYYNGDFISKRQLVYSLLNVLFFVPWGFLLSFFYSYFVRRIIMVTMIGFLTSFLIEITQLITHTGLFEITDLLTNTLGGFIGCLIASILILLWGIVVRLRSKK